MLFTRENVRAFRRDPLFFATPILSLVALFATSVALSTDIASRSVIITTAGLNVLWAACMQRLVSRVSGAPKPWAWLAVGAVVVAGSGAVAFVGVALFKSAPLPPFETIIQTIVLLGVVLGLPLGSCLWLARHHRHRHELFRKSPTAS